MTVQIPPSHTVYIGQAGIKITAGKGNNFFLYLWKLQAHTSRILLLKCQKFEFVSYFKDDN